MPAATRPVALVMGLLLIGAAFGDEVEQRTKPHPSLTPADVVRIQVEAFGRNGRLPDDGGIRTAFRFASPRNRESTGPVERFIELVKNPGYRDMLDHREATYEAPILRDGRAAQRVTLLTLDFRQREFVFFLTRVDAENCDGCWMTDAVQPVSAPDSIGAERIGV